MGPKVPKATGDLGGPCTMALGFEKLLVKWEDAGPSSMQMPTYSASLVGHGPSVAARGGPLGVPSLCVGPAMTWRGAFW